MHGYVDSSGRYEWSHSKNAGCRNTETTSGYETNGRSAEHPDRGAKRRIPPIRAGDQER